MPRYDALVSPDMLDSSHRYQLALGAFKKTCAAFFSSADRRLEPEDFFGPRPQFSDDLPGGAQIVFTLILDFEGRERLCEKRDDIADVIAWQVFVHTSVRVFVLLAFPPVGWSFLKAENIAIGLTAHISNETIDFFEKFGGGRE